MFARAATNTNLPGHGVVFPDQKKGKCWRTPTKTRLHCCISNEKRCGHVWHPFQYRRIISLLKTSTSLHIYWVERQRTQIGPPSADTEVFLAAYVSCQQLRIHLQKLLQPLTAGNAACVCSDRLWCQVMLPRPELSPADLVLSIQSMVPSDICPQSCSLCRHHSFGYIHPSIHTPTSNLEWFDYNISE